MPLFGPPNVSKMKDRHDVEGLIKALSYRRSWFVRKTAAEALGEIGDAYAVEPLSAALKSKDTDVCASAAKALGKIGAPAVEPLIAALEAEEYDVRMHAARALGKIGDCLLYTSPSPRDRS